MTTHSDLERIRLAFPEFHRDFTPPWGLPSVPSLRALERRLRVVLPPSHFAFHVQYASVLPPPSPTLFWPRPDRASGVTSIAVGFKDARDYGVPAYLLPFAGDDCNFLCFDTAVTSELGEPPVVFWDHDERDVLRCSHLSWPHFPAWLEAQYNAMRKRRGGA